MTRNPFLDISDRMVMLENGGEERGLLGMAFPTRFRDVQRFIVHYSARLREEAPENWDHTSRISEFMSLIGGGHSGPGLGKNYTGGRPAISEQ